MMSLEDIIDQLPVNIYWKNKEGVILGCNQTMIESFGLSSKEICINKTDYAFLCSEEAEKIQQLDQEVIRTGKTIVAEEVVKMSSNNKAVFLSIKKPLKNQEGEITGILGCSVDITESKRTQLNELQVLNTIISLMPGNVYWIDRQGHYLGCNDNELYFFGISSKEDLIGKRNTDFQGFLISEILNLVNKKVMETGQNITLEEPALLKGGGMATYLTNKGPIKNEYGEVVGMVGISFDITERKQHESELKKLKEEADRASKIKTEFIKSMQHDIQTPAAGLYQALSRMKECETDPQSKSYLEMLSRMSLQLVNLCRNFMDTTDAELGEHPFMLKEINIRQLASAVLDLHKYTAFNKGLTLYLSISEKAPLCIISDEMRLQRILMNLLGNAIKFTQEGSVSLSIDVDDNNCLCVTVKDTGIGIAADKLNSIFEKYIRAVNEKDGYPGFGLGLYIVNKFARDLKASVDVSSRIGGGTSFTLRLPHCITGSGGVIVSEFFNSPFLLSTG